ncbi:MAG: hypothetical protein D6746_11370 [Bacteroidetes bacterium]|nr:MAG: hypothetical protein D6746_11370 [Bacteroidota bacterium]
MALIPFAASRRSNRAALIATVATGVATLMGVAGRAWYGRRQRHHRAAEPASETDQPDTRPYPLRTRDELYAMAQERDIAGRSQMTKAELVEALRQTEAA